MMKRLFSYAACAWMLGTFSAEAAPDIRGYLNTGIWYLKNDLANNPSYVSADSYGQAYVQGDFALFNASLNFDALHLQNPQSRTDISLHFKARGLYDLLNRSYSLAPDDRYRYQFDETNLQLGMKNMDLWLGRHTVYEVGGIGVDGVTALFRKSDRFGVGAFGGLGNDPRTLTGYIGPSYRTIPFNADFYTGGVFMRQHTDKFQMDNGVSTLLFKKKVDRSNFFSQFYWNATNKWGFSGILDIGFMGYKGLQRSLLGVNTKITQKLTNRLTLSQYRSIFYKQSDASGIPIPTGLNPAFIVGTAVDTSQYVSLRDEVQIRFGKNYMFTGFEYARRTFDDQNRFKYTIGYYDPEIFNSEFDFRVQTDVIKNFVSFNTSIDMILGRDFANDKFRAEIGATFYANERDLFENGAFVSSKGQVEKETTSRVNFQYNATHNLSFFMNYAYYTEIDIYNQNDHVHTHEVYFSSNIRF